MTAAIIPAALALLASYLIGSIPWAYLVVRWVAHEDITEHGTGNVGAMNVKRTTGSWAWFAVAMVADGMKGLIPTAVAKGLWLGFGLSEWTTPYGRALGTWMTDARLATADPTLIPTSAALLLPMCAVVGAVLGHNYSMWLAIKQRRVSRTGKGLATGGGALLAYDWRYFVVAVVVALTVLAITRYMMAGQVAASISLPLAAIAMRQPDWPFALLLGMVVYAAHHNRFMGLLRGEEPKAYTKDGMGPRG